MHTLSADVDFPVAIKHAHCRSRNDRVAFAAHAFMIAEGYKLEAVGDDAEKASSAGTASQDKICADLPLQA